MTQVSLKPFLRPGLDVLFVALNPAKQSNDRGHYFSGSRSRFFDLLHESGLITRRVDRGTADDVVFGTTAVNHRGAAFGVVDLIRDVVDSNSNNVKPSREHVTALIADIHRYEPRFVCIIHSKVREAMHQHAGLSAPLKYGVCGPVIPGSRACVVLNYFPNGNAIPDEPKLAIFRTLRDML